MTEPAGAPAPDTTDMLAVHQVFRTALGDAPAVLDSARSDDSERVELVRSYYDNVLRFLASHHDTEDCLVFPLLVERDPEDRARIDEIAGQHHDVTSALDHAQEEVAAFGAAPSPATRQSAAAALTALDASLTPHLDQEEEFILPLAARYLSMEEWGALPGHGMATFTGDKIWLILGLLRENMSQAQRDAMLAHMPPPAVDMWQNMGNAAFAAMIAEVRQTA
jgi:hemerythrin-like domain-containing protein